MIHEGTKIDIASLLKQVNITFKNHVNAWENSYLNSDVWSPSPEGFLRANFDVAIQSNYSVSAVVASDDKGKVLAVYTLKLASTEVLEGESAAALLATRLASSIYSMPLVLEGDSLITIQTSNCPESIP